MVINIAFSHPLSSILGNPQQKIKKEYSVGGATDLATELLIENVL